MIAINNTFIRYVKMKTTFKSLFLIALFHFCFVKCYSQIRTFCFKSVVTSITGANYISGSVVVGDTVYGTIKYDMNLPDTNPIPQGADYVNTSVSTGIYAKVGNIVCQSNTINPVCTLNVEHQWYANPDVLMYRTKKNTCDIPFSAYLSSERYITFALNDPSQTVLPNTNIPSFIDLNSWTSRNFQVSAILIDYLSPFKPVIASAYISSNIISIDTICSPLTSVKNLDLINEKVRIFPNPNNGQFIIEISTTKKNTVQIIDLNGRLLLNQIITESTNIDASNLNDGVYNLTIKNNASVINRKLIITR